MGSRGYHVENEVSRLVYIGLRTVCIHTTSSQQVIFHINWPIGTYLKTATKGGVAAETGRSNCDSKL